MSVYRTIGPLVLTFAQNLDCGDTLEPPHRCGSVQDPQSVFWSKNKKTRYTLANPSFVKYKVGFEGGIGGVSILYTDDMEDQDEILMKSI